MWDEQIYKWYQQIEDLRKQIKCMEDQMNQCEDAYYRIKQDYQKYDETCDMQKIKALDISNDFTGTKFAKYYGECAEQIFHGEKQKKVLEIFEEVLERIRIQKNHIEDDIQDLHKKITELEIQIEEAQRQREVEQMQ